MSTHRPYHASILGDDPKLPSRLCVDWDPDWPDCFDLTEEAVTSLSPTAAPSGTVYDKQCLSTADALWLYRSLGEVLRLAGALPGQPLEDTQKRPDDGEGMGDGWGRQSLGRYDAKRDGPP